MYNEVGGLTVRVNADISALKSDLREASKLGAQFGRSMTTAFEDAVFRGKDLGDVLRNLALSLSKSVFRAAFKPVGDAAGGFFSQLFGGAGSAGGVLSGLFAKQGSIAAPPAFPLVSGKSAFSDAAVPTDARTLTRGADGRSGVHACGAGRSITIHFNVSTPDVAGFRRSETQINAMLNRAVARGERNL